MINEAKEQRRNQRNKSSEPTRPKSVRFAQPADGSENGGQGGQGQGGQRRQTVSEVVKKMDISHTGYLTVLVSWILFKQFQCHVVFSSGNQDLFPYSL